MDRVQRVVIIGGGEAGFRAAQELRATGYDGRLTMVCAESVAPYYRPPLSKGYLRGEETAAAIASAPPEWYREQGIEVLTDTAATAIEPGVRRVVLHNGPALPYDRLLLATGSRARALGLAGEDLPGVLSLRSAADCDRLRQAMAGAEAVAVIGAGWIGLEFAAAARGAGLPVTVLESAPAPLLRVLGPRVAQIFAELHRAHGVDLRCGVGVKRIVGSRAAEGVELADGGIVAADLVLVAAGAVPNTELAAAAGLAVGSGVLVDEFMTTSDPAILAAGDVAEAWHPLLRRRIRVEHVQNAADQGRAAARTILGRGQPYQAMPFFWSDQYDLGMEYVGFVDGPADTVLRGEPEAFRFVAAWLQGGVLVAGMHANVWDATDPLRGLLGRRVDPAQLADPAVPLGEAAIPE